MLTLKGHGNQFLVEETTDLTYNVVVFSSEHNLNPADAEFLQAWRNQKKTVDNKG